MISPYLSSDIPRNVYDHMISSPLYIYLYANFNLAYIFALIFFKDYIDVLREQFSEKLDSDKRKITFPYEPKWWNCARIKQY